MPKYQSPHGDEIIATLEQVPCICRISEINEDGTPEYDGTGSDVLWDDQKPIKRDGKPIFLDEDGNYWTFDQLTKVDEEEETDA